MMNFLTQYGLFLAQTITLVLAILFVFGSLINLINRNREKNVDQLSLKKLNDKFDFLRDDLHAEILPKKEYKKWAKAEKKRLKEEEKTTKSRVFVICFDGDIMASGTDELREEITAIITTATTTDEVVVCLESPGGVIHGYGLAASQLKRLRDRNIPVTVCVDKIAASGGYMMACVANKIVAAPFSIIGSIGVIIEMPNFHKLLKKHDVDYELLTAGEYKRTLTLFGQNTPKGREKMQEEIEEAHTLFKDFIKQ
ncbi:MAG: inner rane peptidase, partial [Gammaproteobacteria bacterium]|nr:inner rane peptidase [Gammaproteobacteria bacterium]